MQRKKYCAETERTRENGYVWENGAKNGAVFWIAEFYGKEARKEEGGGGRTVPFPILEKP